MNPDDKTPEPRTMPIRFDPRMSGQARNSPCSCGSGKKAKRCCIAAKAASTQRLLAEYRTGSTNPGAVCIALRNEVKG